MQLVLPEVMPPRDACQRWRHGLHSWRRRRDGGFNADRYCVGVIDKVDARAFVLAHHYASTFPVAMLNVGLFDRTAAGEVSHPGRLVGAAVFSVPMRAQVLTTVLPELEPYEESAELGRLVLQGPHDLPHLAARVRLGGTSAVSTESGPDYEWRLREAMALKGMWHTNELLAPLAARGLPLSRSQVFRLVSSKPGRVTIPLILALCDILGCRFDDLVVAVEPGATKRRGTRPADKVAPRQRRAASAAGLGPPVPPEFFDEQR